MKVNSLQKVQCVTIIVCYRMNNSNLHAYLQSISISPPDTTLLPLDNVPVLTHQHLLAAVSPYLASLLAQAGQGATISLPFTSKVVTKVMQVLVAGGKNDTMEIDVVEAAGEMGIMHLVEEAKKIPLVKTNFDDKDTKAEINSNIKLSTVNVNTEVISTRFRNATLNKVSENKNGNVKDDLNKEPELKKEDEDDDYVDEKVDKDFMLHMGAKSIKKKRKHGNEQIDDNCQNILCDVCGKVFSTLGIRNTHMKTVHSVAKPFSCGQCDKSFSTAGIRKSHIRNRHSEDKTPHLPCEECGKLFRTAGSLKTHIEMIHKSGQPSPCPQCGKPVRYLESHLKSVHTTIRNFGCEECGRMFKTKGEVTDHKKIHLPEEIKSLMKAKQVEKNKCNDCGQGFTDSGNLKRHIAVKHTGIRSFLCQECPASYFRSDKLKHHVTNNHGVIKSEL